ncbi:hypothetical protein [Aerolutibacter daejeonensis]|nr:hypothetical protein [Lysobacter daejeonensis]
MLTNLPLLDEVLSHHAAQLGRDFEAYRNHAYRVANFCWSLAGLNGLADDHEALRTISLAAAFHDLGIWTDDTFDYLAPSQRLAREWISSHGGDKFAGEVGVMICQHHKITPYRGSEGGLVEMFRRADWADVSKGLVAPGLSRELRREVFDEFPDSGFHKRLLMLSYRRFLNHPLNPLPMLKL